MTLISEKVIYESEKAIVGINYRSRDDGGLSASVYWHSPIEVNRVRPIYISTGADLTGIGRRCSELCTNVKGETDHWKYQTVLYFVCISAINLHTCLCTHYKSNLFFFPKCRKCAKLQGYQLRDFA